MLKVLTEISRIVVGVTFAFSGFVKSTDPHGFAYKIQDYLISFNLTELFPLALPAAVLLVAAEFWVGIFLLLGIYRKTSIFAAALFMAFFLPLTLWIAIADPVKDCGCFGDALIISNWDTFYKNIVLTACTLVLLFNRRRIIPLFSVKTEKLAAFYVIFFGISFALYNVQKLPVFDFRPYKIGANIPEQMQADPAKADVVENIFVYSQNNENHEFTEENYPWNDTTWTFVEMKTKVIREGKSPAIEDFRIEEYQQDSLTQEYIIGVDITDGLLADTNYSFLMIAHSLEKMNNKHLPRFLKANDYAREKGYPFFLLTASPPNVIADWSKKHNAAFDFAFCDERVLKTMIRSNPGLMLLQAGTVLNKWDDADIPDFTNQQEIEKPEGIKNNFAAKLALICLILLLPLIALKIIDLKLIKT